MPQDDKPDSIIDDVRASMESLREPEPIAQPDDPAHPPIDQTPANANEAAQQTADRERDDKGRFAKGKPERPTLTLAKPEKPLAGASPTTAAPSAPVEGTPAAPTDGKPERIPPPAEWGGLAKVKWDRLPVDVQKEIAAHEATRAAAVGDLAPVAELLNVNREFLVNQAGSLPGAMTELMQFAKMSVENPVRLIQTIAARTGIDLRAFAGGQQAAPAQPQPADLETYIQRRIDERLQPFQAERDANAQQQTQATIAQIKAFQADAAHPFFNDAFPTMQRMLESGEIPFGPPPMERLAQAYDRATWSNPTIREHLQSQAREAEGQRQAAEAKKAREALRPSLNGAPLSGAMGANGKDNNRSALEDVRAAAEEIAGRL